MLNGLPPRKPKVCVACGGSKFVWNGSFSAQEPCGECGGTGEQR